MPQIRSLFDSTRALSRPIEKVITYQNRSEAQLGAEISEYVVTEHLEESFSDLLKKMQAALTGGDGHEIGVWVSGFYGSGKSSFTKYLGFALDHDMRVGDDSFLHLLQNQLKTASTRALFNQVATSYDAVVICLDLASEMLAGASMEDISTVLYLKVLQWAGYSEDLKVAELERMLEMDGKLDAFLLRAKEELEGVEWKEARNQPLVANQIASRLATEFYPKLFTKAEDFQNLKLHVTKSELKRVQEMVDLIRRKSGKKNILFVVDEVGQYASAKPSLILNLDGLAKNLKQIGGGAVWLFATAQQTLTEDNPTAMLNAPGLFKLKDRFPIQIHLEASDIKEICHKRLLTKSAEGEVALGKLFGDSGSELRTATQLVAGGVYDVALDKKTFVDLYPFLPAHFEMLLQLLGRLARKTGGLGLRSAIKVLQDVLVERGGREGSRGSLADAPVKTLANTVTFYDSLRRDIQSSFAHVIDGVDRVGQRLHNSQLAMDVAKSIAVLQVLENLPVNAQNIAALLQPDVSSPSLKDAVTKSIEAMLNDSMIPLGEKNGSLRFLTQAAIVLQKQFDGIEYRQADVRAEINGVLRTLIKPLPSIRLSGARPVTAGLRVAIGGGQSVGLEGEREPIQLVVELVPLASYDAVRSERENDSRSSHERTKIFLLARSDATAEDTAVTMARCRKFLDTYRNALDPETQEFVKIVDERLSRTTGDLERKMHAALLAGSFVAHGDKKAVAELGTDVVDAAKAFLGDTAARVFDRYSEAALQAESGLAERFLKRPIDRITTEEDPLSFVGHVGGRAQIRTDSKALVSIRDYLEQNGQVEGRRLLDHFAEPNFGWSKDTTRYILAATFLAGEIKLRIAGHDQLVKSDESLAALSSNKALGAVGIALRAVRPDPPALLRASDRLRDITGENVLAVEDEIAAVAKKHLPAFQNDFGPLATELRALGLDSPEPSERADNLVNNIAAVVSGDGSDAVTRLGGVESPFYAAFVWARKLKKALDNGLRQTLSHIKRLRQDIAGLPDSGIPATLKVSAADSLASVADILARESFFDAASALGTASHELDRLVAGTTTDLARQQLDLAEAELSRWQASPDWRDLADEDRTWFGAEVAKLAVSVDGTLDGLKKLLSHDYSLNHGLRDLAAAVAKRASDARAARSRALEAANVTEEYATNAEVFDTEVAVPRVFRSAEQIDRLVEDVNKLRVRILAATPVRITWKQVD